ncbi:MAG: hypothetical protein HC919_03320 [Oscillatoriales cyanobacterium SM2_2_1]|nr:hypothetical protein [Oscillatoriales cyanobacterium SM2_2_1]
MVAEPDSYQHSSEQCYETLKRAVLELRGDVDVEVERQLRRTATLIIQTMTGFWRCFHTPKHIFEVGEEGDAIEVLAALFHDLVYVQVDHGIGVNISRYIAPYVREEDRQLWILDPEELPDDPVFTAICILFGFHGGDVLKPYGGQNEFLSALIASKSLQEILSLKDLVAIAACIESTIPFRPPLGDGTTVSEQLYQRLALSSLRYDFHWSEQDLTDLVRRAVRLANRDVVNFASSSSTFFLDNTWNLIPETNHDLRNANSYTVDGYRRSIQNMEGFMSSRQPQYIFRQYKGEPDDDTYAELLQRTEHNLAVACLYLRAKLVSIALIEALSLRIGRDIPLSMMMGGLPTEGLRGATLEQFLVTVPRSYEPTTEMEREVMLLLEKGRTGDSDYDLKNSPVATFLVKSLGFAGVMELLKSVRRFFAKEITGEDLLQHCPGELVDTLTLGMSHIYEYRKTAVLHGKGCLP